MTRLAPPSHLLLSAMVFGVWLSMWPNLCCGEDAAVDLEHERFFETQIRPLLAERCLQCHGESEQSGGLRLDTQAHLLRGGDSGPAFRSGQPEYSRIVQAVRRTDDLAMPPEEALTDLQVRALERWVQLGAPWPKSAARLIDPKTIAARAHWAFQALGDPSPPEVDSDWCQNPLDAFILSELRQHGLTPSAAADRRTMLRRGSMTLTGLPPADGDLKTFLRDNTPDAWSHQVERLLASPAYGEQWARHWLDIARYSDTKGYVYAREDRKWLHAWGYRDWVIRALNEDLPYDRFLLLQIAADQVSDCEPDDLAAMGFLTIGRRFLGVTRDIMDDRIDTITRGTMGLTVACARCHDHKYDPVTATDYYSLYSVLNSCAERRVALPAEVVATDEWQQELQKRKQALDERYAAERQIAAERGRDRLADYLQIQQHMDTVPPQGFDQVLHPDDVIPELARRWEAYLHAANRSRHPVFRHWHAYSALPEDQFRAQAADVTDALRTLPADQVNARVAAAFQLSPTSFGDVVDTYTRLLKEIRAEWTALTDADGDASNQMLDADAEQLRRVLYESGSPCEVPNESLVHNEYLFTTDVCRQLWELQKAVDSWLHAAPHQPRYALTLHDRSLPEEQRVFRRGNPKTHGADVSRRFLSLLGGDDSQPFQRGSGRLELAQAIVSPQNPLTARVLVNRVWGWHFGSGLVQTPSDFGLRAAPPSHPELLDWLTRQFIDHGWSLKHLHRLILTSATWQQRASDRSERMQRQKIATADPSNRLLWRMPLHRLTFEEYRDSILTVSGELDTRTGGRPDSLFGANASLRRSVYGEIDRQFFPTALRIFDVANPDIHVAQRSDTTVPQQALFYLNHRMIQDRARRLAARTADAPTPEARVRKLFSHVLQRSPDDGELIDALQLAQTPVAETSTQHVQSGDWSYWYGKIQSESATISDLVPIPHFTGDAWQGGDSIPDPDLGWVRLSATGGHPGNDHDHVCVRRWTAPRDLNIQLESILKHEPAAGDGVRGLILCSSDGLLSDQTIHQDSVRFRRDRIQMRAGDTLDFVADIGEGLNSDQFLWTITIQELHPEGDGLGWNSIQDFSGPRPTPLLPWEQLAQVLLCSNEFLFVD